LRQDSNCNITLKMKDYAMLQLTECEPHIVTEMSEYFTFEVPGAKFMPAVKKKGNGTARFACLIEHWARSMRALYWAIKKFAMQRGYGIKVEKVLRLPI
jgi:hypothetical protein